MSSAQLEDFLMVAFGAPGLLLLLWAIASRQFRGSEEAKDAVLRGEEPAEPRSAPAQSRLRSRVFFAAIALIFAFITLCPLLVFWATTRANAAPHPHGAAGSSSGALVCPFQ
ncbi:MAG TPA: hypothetical protein VFW40_04640 [Capsulimonadaceae bacterium]|nr:hypothetical protein [Capsulimonadaceae bacterium]